mmetsp:Transcript_55953/g.135409  ORF Transcript_55953/g.135409 Transcript_55953/m.135409 type:complete len:103 (+) Transcript_55953:165-473(+)
MMTDDDRGRRLAVEVERVHEDEEEEEGEDRNEEEDDVDRIVDNADGVLPVVVGEDGVVGADNETFFLNDARLFSSSSSSRSFESSPSSFWMILEDDRDEARR